MKKAGAITSIAVIAGLLGAACGPASPVKGQPDAGASSQAPSSEATPINSQEGMPILLATSMTGEVTQQVDGLFHEITYTNVYGEDSIFNVGGTDLTLTYVTDPDFIRDFLRPVDNANKHQPVGAIDPREFFRLPLGTTGTMRLYTHMAEGEGNLIDVDIKSGDMMVFLPQIARPGPSNISQITSSDLAHNIPFQGNTLILADYHGTVIDNAVIGLATFRIEDGKLVYLGTYTEKKKSTDIGVAIPYEKYMAAQQFFSGK
jgi:hypothetical protein